MEKVSKIFQRTFKTLLTVVFVLLLLTSCNNTINRTEKTPILKADREAPLGWVYLIIYQDSTFEFTTTGIRADKDVFKGNVEIRNDSLFFEYSDSIPRAGKTAIYSDRFVSYIDGEYPEQVNISMTKLSK